MQLLWCRGLSALLPVHFLSCIEQARSSLPGSCSVRLLLLPAGKLLLLDPFDEDTIQMMFDDNVGYGSPHIVDARDINTGRVVPFAVSVYSQLSQGDWRHRRVPLVLHCQLGVCPVPEHCGTQLPLNSRRSLTCRCHACCGCAQVLCQGILHLDLCRM